ncbi:toxin glutamine deamidase domain-containing protein, partial [Streptomyces sp. NPDC048290]|uniref:toxin glutamine deamidase domain-containing protein n=1 Tax=Streptomyces sp. NPDC048290 TaxID=3155811 RepID=UPI003424A1EE
NNATSDENSPLYGDDPGRVWAIVLDADGNQKAPQLTDTEWQQFRDAANALEFLTVGGSDLPQVPTRGRRPILTDTSDRLVPMRTSDQGVPNRTSDRSVPIRTSDQGVPIRTSDRSSQDSEGGSLDKDTRHQKLTAYLSSPALVKLSTESGYTPEHITRLANTQLAELRLNSGQPDHLTPEMLTYKAVAHQKVDEAIDQALAERGVPRNDPSVRNIRDEYHGMVDSHFRPYGDALNSGETHDILPWLSRDVLPPIIGSVDKMIEWDSVHDRLDIAIQNGLGRQIMTAGHDLAVVSNSAHDILENVLEQEQGTDGIAMDVIVNAAMFETSAWNQAHANFYDKVQHWLSAQNLPSETAGAMARTLLPRFSEHFTRSVLEGFFSTPQALLASNRYDQLSLALAELDTKTVDDLELISGILNDVSSAIHEGVQQLTVTGRQVPVDVVQKVWSHLGAHVMSELGKQPSEGPADSGSRPWKRFRTELRNALPGKVNAGLDAFMPPAPRTLMVMNPDPTTPESTPPTSTIPTAQDNASTSTLDSQPPPTPPRPTQENPATDARQETHDRLERYLDDYVPLTDDDSGGNSALRQRAHAILDRLFDVGEPKPRIKHALGLARTYEEAVTAATSTAENLASGFATNLNHDLSKQEIQKAVGYDHGALARTVADTLFMGDPRSLDEPDATQRLNSEVTKETNRTLKVNASLAHAERLIDAGIDAVVTDRAAQNLSIDGDLVAGFRRDLTTQTKDALDTAYRKVMATTSTVPLPTRLKRIEKQYLENTLKPRLGDLASLLDSPVRGVNDLVTQFDKDAAVQRIIPVSALFKDDGTRAFDDPQDWLDRVYGPQGPSDLLRSNFDDNCVIAALAFYATFNAATKADIRGFDSTSLANKGWSHATIAQNALNAAASTMGVGEPALDKIAQQIKDLGPGAQAIVFVSRTPGNPEGHAYNLVNHKGTLVVVDVPHKKITRGDSPFDNDNPGPVWALMFDADGNQVNPPQLTDEEWAQLRNTTAAVQFNTTPHDGTTHVPGHDTHPTIHSTDQTHQPTHHPTGPVHPTHHPIPTPSAHHSNRHSISTLGPNTVPDLPDVSQLPETPSLEPGDQFTQRLTALATSALKSDPLAPEIKKLKNREMVYGDFTDSTAGADVRDALSKRLQSLGATTLEMQQLTAVEEFVRLRTGQLRGAGRDFDIKVGSRVFTARITAQLDLKQAEVLTPSDKTVTTKPKSTTTSVSD